MHKPVNSQLPTSNSQRNGLGIGQWELGVLALVVMVLAGCRPTTPPPVNEVVALVAGSLPIDPGDAAWQRAPEHLAKLVPQDLVEPRLLTPSTPEIRVRALTSGGEIALRLEWVDAAVNDTPGPGAFLDGCAIQIPRTIEASPTRFEKPRGAWQPLPVTSIGHPYFRRR